MPEILMDPQVAWYGQAALSLLVLLLLSMAVRRAWHVIAPPGVRRILVVAVAEHAVIAYGSWEARRVDVELRVFLLTMTLAALLVATGLFLLEEVRTTRKARR